MYCAEMYSLPQMRVVQPIMAVCLGAKTFNSVRRALEVVRPKIERRLMYPQGNATTTERRCDGTPHTGCLGHANAGGMEKVDQIWAGLASRFGKLIRQASEPKTDRLLRL